MINFQGSTRLFIPLTLKISAVIMLIVTFAVTLLVFLTYFKYESTLSGIIHSRFGIVITDTKNTIDSGLSLGVSLPELQTTQQVIERIKERDPQILSIKVFELINEYSGRTVFNTRRAGIGGNVPNRWLANVATAKPNAPWFLLEDGANVIGLNIINNFAKPIGAITVRYSQDYQSNQAKFVLKQLMVKTAGILVISYFITIFTIYLFFRPFTSEYIRMKNQINMFLETNTIPEISQKNEQDEVFHVFMIKAKEVYDNLQLIRQIITDEQEKNSK